MNDQLRHLQKELEGTGLQLNFTENCGIQNLLPELEKEQSEMSVHVENWTECGY